MYRTCGRMSILNAANLPNQESSRFAICLVWISILVIRGFRLVTARELVVLVRVMPRYGIPSSVHEYGRDCCNMRQSVAGIPKFSTRDLVKFTSNKRHLQRV